jgi:hypothetical protein
MTSAKRRTWLDGPVAGGLSLFVSPIPSEFAEPSSCIKNITEPYWFLHVFAMCQARCSWFFEIRALRWCQYRRSASQVHFPSFFRSFVTAGPEQFSVETISL